MELSLQHKTKIQQIVSSKSLGHDPNHFLAYHLRDPIIYGADKPQRLYLQLLLFAQAIRESNNSDRIVSTDTFDPKDTYTFDKSAGPAVSNYFIDWNKQGQVSTKGFSRRTDGSQDVRESNRQGFANAFASSSYNIGALDSESLKDENFFNTLFRGIKKDNPGLKQMHRATLVNSYADQLKNFAVRRACKFLLWESVLQHGRLVAYALDDLDLETVAKRRQVNLGGNRNKVPICTSELRELFRNYDSFIHRVIFFKDFQVVPPPWEMPTAGKTDNLRIWAEYAVKRSRKVLSSNPNSPYAPVYKQVIDFNKAQQYEDAIGAFHWARPSLEGKKTASWGQALSIQDD